MANMSYCRFRNTLKDLQDCWDNWNDAENSEERQAQIKLEELIKEIAEEVL